MGIIALWSRAAEEPLPQHFFDQGMISYSVSCILPVAASRIGLVIDSRRRT